MAEPQPFFYFQLPTVPVPDEFIQHICRDLCGGKCCSDEIFGDFRPNVDEASAKEIEALTGKSRQEFIETQEDTGIPVMKRDERGWCVFHTGECGIHGARPQDCRMFPEASMAFPLARLVLRMPIDLPQCLLSQAMLGKLLPEDQITPEVEEWAIKRDEAYWRMIARLIGETPTDEEVMDENFKNSVRESVLAHWRKPHSHPSPTSEELPRGHQLLPLAKLPEEKT